MRLQANTSDAKPPAVTESRAILEELKMKLIKQPKKHYNLSGDDLALLKFVSTLCATVPTRPFPCNTKDWKVWKKRVESEEGVKLPK